MRTLKNIDKEFLVDLFNTATYGSDWLIIKTLKSERNLDKDFDKEYLESRCVEDRWADRLIAGGHIVCCDMYAEEGDDDARKVIDLHQIQDGLHKALDECPRDLADFLEEEDDYFTCNNLMHVIMFGEVIYG